MCVRCPGVAALSKRWGQLTGNIVGPEMDLQSLGTARLPSCCTLRGVGRCNCHLTDSETQSLLATHDLVRRLARAADLYQTSLPGEFLLPTLAAVHIRPQQRETDEFSGLLYIVVAASKKPLFPVLLPCVAAGGGPLGELSIGVRFQLDQVVENGSLNFCGPGHVTNALHERCSGKWRVDLVSYRFVSMSVCETTAVEEVTGRLLGRKPRKPAADTAQDKDPTLRLIEELEAEPPEPKAKRHKATQGAADVKATILRLYYTMLY